MRTKFNPVFSFAAASALALAMGMPAETANATIMLTPAVATDTTDVNSNLTTLALINAAFGTTYTDLTMSYKANVGSGEEGPYAGNYATVFSNSASDPADALITWDNNGEPFIPCPTCLLIVKDGNQTPAQYLFDLGAWDGQESIQMTGFWPNQGAISNVAIWSGSTSTSRSTSRTGGQTSTGGQTRTGGQIPEPGVLALLGAGLLGQVFLLRQRRRRLQK